MKNIINHLRTYRKNTYITQNDIAALLELEDNSLISRCEQGVRSPSLEMVLLYHLVFDIPMLTLVANQISHVKEQLVIRLARLIDDLKLQEVTVNTEARIEFLKIVFARLSEDISDEK
jgi:transcriptional regulator with XRE-family HTH domain